MNYNYSDVIVVGSGMAGLMASITAASIGASVNLLSQGAGVLSIGTGAIDFLGYVNNKKIISSPFDYIGSLGNNHPYNIIGAENIRKAFDSLINIAKNNYYDIFADDKECNQEVITIAGTIKPTYICSKSNSLSRIFNSNKILFIGVEYLKDYQVSLASRQIKEYKEFSGSEIDSIVIKSPFGNTHRMLTSLDLARYVDTDEGFNWLKSELIRVSYGYDGVIIPPICGINNYNKVFNALDNLGFTLVEAVSIPPDTGGNRLCNALINEAKSLNINFIENANVERAIIENGKCNGLVALHNDIADALESKYFAEKFIIATGGILGGGIVATYDKVYEKIFNIEIPSPVSIEERSDNDVFSNHLFSKFGITVNNKLQAIDNKGAPLYENVFFAGRTLGNYDFSKEKSGYGVACSTGYVAGLSATV